MPKNRRRNQTEVSKKPRIPNKQEGEILGVCLEILGGDHMVVKGEDGITYLGVVRGKIRKRMWIRQGDLVLIIPWDFQTKPKEGKRPKAYIVWRYTLTQLNWLQNHGYIKQEFIEELNNI